MLYILDLVAKTFQRASTIIFHFFTIHYFEQILPSLKSEAMKSIVILGGSHAGISTAHRILKQAPKTSPFKITLVSPNTHFYWNLASPRALVGQLTDDELFRPIAAGFSQYSSTQFEFVVGSAESLDVEAKKVDISTSTGARNLDYDYLILATGARVKGGLPMKGLGSTEATKDALHTYQDQVKKSKKIVVAGAGVTGSEVAGELGFTYGRDKEIILVSLSHVIISSISHHELFSAQT